MENQIPSNIQEERSKQLLILSQQNQQQYHKKYIGKQVQVLLEDQEDTYIKGHTSNYLLVKIPYQPILHANQMVHVLITNHNQNELIGELM